MINHDKYGYTIDRLSCLVKKMDAQIEDGADAYGLVDVGVEYKPVIEEAIELLKLQEPIAPQRYRASVYCGQCDKKLVFNQHNQASYCWQCGRAVKWG